MKSLIVVLFILPLSTFVYGLPADKDLLTPNIPTWLKEKNINSTSNSPLPVLDCFRELKVLNRSAIKIAFLFDPEVESYESPDDFKVKYCDPWPTWYKQVLGFKKCLRSLVRTMFVYGMRRMKTVYNQWCLNEKRRQLAYDHLTCMTKETKAEIIATKDMFYSVLDYISQLDDENDIIPGMCCATNEGTRVAKDMISKICDGKGLPDTPDYAVSLVTNTIAQMFDIVCGASYPSVEACWKTQPKIMEGIRYAIENPEEATHDMVFLPVMDIIKRIAGSLDISLNVH